MKAQRLLILVAAFVVAIQGWRPSLAESPIQQATDGRYFPETGHWVKGVFLTTYDSVPNPTEIYGYPITESILDPLTGRPTQYFEKARFELSSEFPTELQVFLAPLGFYLYEPTPELYVPISDRRCRHFQESGKRVCVDFLDFFKANGGAAQFGYPISNFELHDGLIVQYFQRSRFEWHPKNPPGEQVIVSNLGEQYFDKFIAEPEIRHPVPGPEITGAPLVVLSLRVRAYPRFATMPPSGTQILYITLQDQRPIVLSESEFNLEIKIKWPSGREQTLPIKEETNRAGVITYRLDYSEEPEGLVEIAVHAASIEFENIEARTTTSFRIWY